MHAAQKEMWKCRWCSSGPGPFSSPPISSFFSRCFKRLQITAGWMLGALGKASRIWWRRPPWRGWGRVGIGRARAGRGTKKGPCMPARGRWPPEPGRSPAQEPCILELYIYIFNRMWTRPFFSSTRHVPPPPFVHCTRPISDWSGSWSTSTCMHAPSLPRWHAALRPDRIGSGIRCVRCGVGSCG